MQDGLSFLQPEKGQAVFSSANTSFTSLFSKLLSARGFSDPAKIEKFLSAGLDQLEDPFLMKGMAEAVERLGRAKQNREKILIHGDYDVDGVTGTALMSKTLKALGVEFFTFLPDRVEDGYGVSARAILEAAADKKVTLLITVDCGITAKKDIETAVSKCVDVIVIDHHRVPEDGLPSATVILNPQQSDCAYPFKDLSAAGLVFKLAQALLGNQAFQFLDLAALSTVCDVAPLRDENRIIVKKGLELLSSRSCPGIQAMSEAAKIKTQQMNSGHIGFILGPRINAAGRMNTPDIALRLLMSESVKEAVSLAGVLEEENKMRQKEERQVTKEAIEQAERVFHFNRDRVVVVAAQGWHQGVIGIVASRLVERFHRPSIVIAIDGPKGKGSGRSIKGFHLFDALNDCKELFIEFGGHEQAAGLSVKEENITAFRERINEYARQKYDAAAFQRQVSFDLEIQLEDIRTGFMRELELLEPHGAGNPRPTFLTKNLEVKTRPEKIFGETYKFFVTDGIFTYETLWNDKAGEGPAAIAKGQKIHLYYSAKTKVWDGVQSIALEAKDIKPA